MNALVDWWRDCKLETAPFAHEKDWEVLKRYKNLVISEPLNFESFVGGERFSGLREGKLHLSLLPHPYSGQLSTADIFILQLNPGMHVGDYYAEYRSDELRQALIKNLRQELDDVSFPFMWLNPQYCWHPGFMYWEGKLRDVVNRISEKQQISYRDALHALSKRIACLELVAYHSQKFSAHNLIRQLSSAEQVLRYVKDQLVPEARAGKKALIVTRQTSEWGLKEEDNIILYDRNEARGAYMTKNSKGGAAILKRFGIS